MQNNQLTEFKMKAMNFQYWYTAILATALGLFIQLCPNLFAKLTGIKEQDHTFFGIGGSVYSAFGLLAMLGLRSPKKFAPILLLQFTYKMLWFILVMGLRIKQRTIRLRWTDIAMLMGYASFVAGDILAVPWRSIFKKEA